MRLSESEAQALVRALLPFLPETFQGSLLLYGSRVSDVAKGGDIDLVLVVKSEQDLSTLSMKDFKIKAAMKIQREIGDRKIDFKVLSEEESSSVFFKEALRNSISLYDVPKFST